MTPAEAINRNRAAYEAEYKRAAVAWAAAVAELNLDGMWAAWRAAEAAVTRWKSAEQQWRPGPSHL